MKKKTPTSKTSKRSKEKMGADDEENGDDGKAGGSGSGGMIPSYFDIFASNADEAEITALAAKALQENRISLKSKGHSVSALDKRQEARSRMQNNDIGPEQEAGGPSGTGLENHPELAESGGMIDPNIIVLPKSEQEALAVQDLDLKLELLAKYKKKMDMKMGMALKEQPRPGPTIRPTNTPSRPRPRPF